MKLFPFLFFLISLIGVAEARLWTLQNGRTVEGDIANFFGGLVHIVEEDGKSYLFKVTDLSVPDQERVVEFVKARPERPLVADSESELTRFLRGRLVRPNEKGRLRPFSIDDRTEPEIYALYFSASWCPPCNDFTPKLVAFYRAMQFAGYDNFELILVSSDRTGGDMADYMMDYSMPFPGLKFSSRNSRKVGQFSGSGIPCLTLVDAQGNLIWHTYVGGEYKGPSQSMDVLRTLLQATNYQPEEETAEAEPVAAKE